MVRRVGSLGLAAVVTFGLFYLMHALVILTAQAQQTDFVSANIEFVRVPRDSEVQTKKKPDRPKAEQPPPPKIEAPRAKRPQLNDPNSSLGIPTPNFGKVSQDNPFGTMGAVPLVRIAPEYPRRAAQMGLGGWVLLEFDISPIGTTENVRVIDSEPPRTFDRAAIRAVQRFKYRPKVEDGKPLTQTGMQIVITFDPPKDSTQ